MAKIVTKKGSVSTAYGQTLATPVEFEYQVNELQKGDEIPADEVPDADDILALVNSKRNASARAKAQNEALNAAGVEKPDTNTPDFRYKQMVKLLTANGMPQEAAEASAKTLIYG